MIKFVIAFVITVRSQQLHLTYNGNTKWQSPPRLITLRAVAEIMLTYWPAPPPAGHCCCG